ncbi:hypothetical protein NECAME_11741 [Necator americanus]|uniref:Uncharacterized protein n=1 Tax=Necator americanus TaxID=51031 RepID=W2T476_NECAM|nr:hypothetical protein NECAME_11741 [Necator americanus]ETN76359.1 hypothetical protein NECAME_11741 [Necator americanus]
MSVKNPSHSNGHNTAPSNNTTGPAPAEGSAAEASTGRRGRSGAQLAIRNQCRPGFTSAS